MDAIEMLKDKMLSYMVSKGDSPKAEAEESPMHAEPPMHEEAPPPEDEGSLEIEIDTAPQKPSVFSRVGDGPPMPSKKSRKRKPSY